MSLVSCQSMLLRRFAVSLVAARPAVRALPPLRAFATAPRIRLSDDKRYTKSEWKNSLMVEYDEMKRISSAPDDVRSSPLPCLC